MFALHMHLVCHLTENIQVLPSAEKRQTVLWQNKKGKTTVNNHNKN